MRAYLGTPVMHVTAASSTPLPRYSMPEDAANLAVALHSWKGRLSLKFADQLAFEVRRHLPLLDAGSLINLIGLLGAAVSGPRQLEDKRRESTPESFSAADLPSLLFNLLAASNSTRPTNAPLQGHTPSPLWSAELLEALQNRLDDGPLRTPGLYAAAMHALLAMRVRTPPEIFDAMAVALMQEIPAPSEKRAPPGAAASKEAVTMAMAAAVAAADKASASSASSGVKRGGSTRLQGLSAREAAVVLAALSAQTDYTPEPGFVDGLLEQLCKRCTELRAADAAGAVALLPAVLRDADAREDAAELIDELLAVAEAGLPSVPPEALRALAGALAALGHAPDALLSSSLSAEVLGRVASLAAAAEAAKSAAEQAKAERSKAAKKAAAAGKEMAQSEATAAPSSPLVPNGRPSLVLLVEALALLPPPSGIPHHPSTSAAAVARGAGGIAASKASSSRGLLSADELASLSKSLVAAGEVSG